MNRDGAPEAAIEGPGGATMPVCLGLAGLLPFWTLALMPLAGLRFGLPAGTLSFALAVYGATILSFLGGIRWGLAVAASTHRSTSADYALSVLPQLLAWITLLLPDSWRMAGLGVLLLATGGLDLRLVTRGLAPAWFGRLRLILSLGAGAALLVASLSAR